MKQSIQELAETEIPDVRGSSLGTIYGSEPVKFLQEVMDAAKKQFFFANFVSTFNLEPGTTTLSIPKRTTYEGNAGMTWNAAGSDSHGTSTGTGPYANTIADISWTTLDNNANVGATPSPVLAGYAIRRYDIRANALNLAQWAKDELSYAIGDRIDVGLGTACGSDDKLTLAQSGIIGKIALFGGDATAASSLAAGDTLTTDLIATAARYLKSKQNWYRATGSGQSGTFTFDSTVTKNTWQNTPDDPFVLFIGPAQEEALRKDSQFVNAAEYGDNTVVQNGEIGQYLGIRIVVTSNVEQTAASGTAPDNTAAAVATTRCVLMKAKKALALVWGQSPSIEVFEYLSRDQIRIGLFCAYTIVAVHSDAVVSIDVSDA